MLYNSIAKSFLFSKVLYSPFWGIFLLLQMILYKECHATALQLSTIIALKPICGIFSAYWSQFALSKKIVTQLVLAQLLKFTPFLLFPFLSNNWLIILAFALHMTLARGVMPAWMELLKHQKENSTRLCAWGGNIDYVGTTFLPLLYGWILDCHPGSWRFLFFITSLLSLLSLYFILKIPSIPLPPAREEDTPFLAPWKSLKVILKNRPDFRHFQMGFFLGGAGLMIMQPALPLYFIGSLKLSYTAILLAIATSKGIGFILSSSSWTKLLQKKSISHVCSIVTFFAALFPLILFAAQWNVLWINVAYLVYGIMQGGSELCWKISGPLFSKNEPSAPYSSINVLMVGIRGLFFPFLGGVLCNLGGASYTLAIGGALCILSTIFLRRLPADVKPLYI